MKTAIYIENGTTQIVLTPENIWEKQVINSVETSSDSVFITRGHFFENQAGYFRQGTSDESLILRTIPRAVVINNMRMDHSS